LEEAAFSLFAQQGYDATTVDEISEAAQVSPRTFFRYFATKEDVVFGDQNEQLERLRAALANDASSDGEVVAGALLAFCRSLEEHRDSFLGRHRLVLANPSLQGRVLLLENAWAAAIADVLAQKSGNGTPSFEQQVLATCGIGVLSCALHEWHETGAPLDELTVRALTTFGMPTPVS
jgi:AcrR family transcriptional regulator